MSAPESAAGPGQGPREVPPAGEQRDAEKVYSPLLLRQAQAARFVGLSPREWRRWVRRGAVPTPIQVSSRPLWSAEELRAWVLASCPPRERWTALRLTQLQAAAQQRGQQ